MQASINISGRSCSILAPDLAFWLGAPGVAAPGCPDYTIAPILHHFVDQNRVLRLILGKTRKRKGLILLGVSVGFGIKRVILSPARLPVPPPRQG
jgi:hypothetical protein